MPYTQLDPVSLAVAMTHVESAIVNMTGAINHLQAMLDGSVADETEFELREEITLLGLVDGLLHERYQWLKERLREAEEDE